MGYVIDSNVVIDYLSGQLPQNGRNIMESKVVKVRFDSGRIFIRTAEGEEKSHPLSWFPKLQNATKAVLENFTLSPFGIHWEQLDEDLSFEGFFSYAK